jgi:uncharacterized protein involved in type VI secretion and phage assembly
VSDGGPSTLGDAVDEPTQRLAGVYRAVVTDARDPEGRRRVRVKVRSVAQEEEPWAVVVRQGKTFFVPEVGDEVLVAFEGGDPRVPYVLGFLWSSSDTPPETSARGTRSGGA